MSIDLEDVGNSALYGSLAIVVVVVVLYLIFSKPFIDECEAAGGITVKSNGDLICIDRAAVLKKEAK